MADSNKLRIPNWLRLVGEWAASHLLWTLLLLLAPSVFAFMVGLTGGVFRNVPTWAVVAMALGAVGVVTSLSGIVVISRGSPATIRQLTAERDRLSTEFAGLRDAIAQLRSSQAISDTTAGNRIRTLEDELRQWRPDGISGQLRQLAMATFPFLPLQSVYDVHQLLYNVYLSPFTAVPLDMHADVGPGNMRIALTPVSSSVIRPESDAANVQAQLQALVVQVRNRSHQDKG